MAALYPGELGFLRCHPLLSWCLDCIREDIDVPPQPLTPVRITFPHGTILPV